LPAITRAYRALERKPELVVVDGHGFAHPRRFGIACYVGVKFDVASIVLSGMCKFKRLVVA